jgi:hypothetical protein
MCEGGPMTPEQQAELNPRDVALTRYGQVLGYLQYENTVYWTRVGFVMAAQAALIAFSANHMLAVQNPHSPLSLPVALGAGVLGLVLCLLGLRMVQGSVRWINHWHDLLRELELTAYGDIQVFRNTGSIARGGHSYAIKDAASQVMYVFIVAWLLLLTLLVGYLSCR